MQHSGIELSVLPFFLKDAGPLANDIVQAALKSAVL